MSNVQIDLEDAASHEKVIRDALELARRILWKYQHKPYGYCQYCGALSTEVCYVGCEWQRVRDDIAFAIQSLEGVPPC